MARVKIEFVGLDGSGRVDFVSDSDPDRDAVASAWFRVGTIAVYVMTVTVSKSAMSVARSMVELDDPLDRDGRTGGRLAVPGDGGAGHVRTVVMVGVPVQVIVAPATPPAGRFSDTSSMVTVAGASGWLPVVAVAV